MKLKTIIGLVLIAGFSFLVIRSFEDQLGGYMAFDEAASTGSFAHVVGTWVEDQHFTYDRDRNVFQFYMQDEQGIVRPVAYHNPKPANFEDADQLVVEGQFQGDVFVAEHILVKCPSKYNAADPTTIQATATP